MITETNAHKGGRTISGSAFNINKDNRHFSIFVHSLFIFAFRESRYAFVQLHAKAI